MNLPLFKDIKTIPYDKFQKKQHQSPNNIEISISKNFDIYRFFIKTNNFVNKIFSINNTYILEIIKKYNLQINKETDTLFYYSDNNNQSINSFTEIENIILNTLKNVNLNVNVFIDVIDEGIVSCCCENIDYFKNKKINLNTI